MSKIKLLLVAVLCVGMFFSSGVFAERIEIGGGTFSATIDGEYGETGAEAYGVYVNYSPLLSLTFTVDAVGNIDAENESGDAYAYGVYTTRDINIINHQGSMEVEATGMYSYATGIEVDSTNLASLTNSGNIKVETTGYDYSYAYGVYSCSGGTISSEGNINYLNNSGNITATAKQEGEEDGEIGSLGYYYDYDVVAFGVLAESDAGSGGDAESSGGNINSLTNSGTIKAEATTEDDAVYVSGVQAFSYAYSEEGTASSSGGNIYSLTNSKDITATGTSPYLAEVYGVSAYSKAYSESSRAESSGGNIYSLTNSGNITASATATEMITGNEIPLQGSVANAYGVSAYSYASSWDYYGYGIESSGGNIYSLTNSGSIKATGESDYDAYVYGISAYSSGENYTYGNATSSGGNIYNLTNSRTIEAKAEAGYYAEAYGVSAYSYAYAWENDAYSSGGNISNLTNSGTISATAIVSGVEDLEIPLQEGSEAYAYGIYTCSVAYSYDYYAESTGGNITNLTNSGTIRATAEGYDSHAAGIYAYNYSESETGGVITGLNNSGTISAIAGGYDEDEDMYLAYNAYSYGVAAEGGIYSSTNSGNIVSSSQGFYQTYAGGIGSRIITDFDNSGTIGATAGSYGISYSIGVMGFFMSDFTNSGTISASSNGYEALAMGISSTFIDGLTNSGIIKAEAVCDSTYATQMPFAAAVGIGGIDEEDIIPAAFTEIVNTGTINASVRIVEEGYGSAVGILGYGGIPLQEEEPTIVNEGLILVQAEAPEGTDPENIHLGGIVITGGNVVISNPGEIRLESNIDGVEARALVVDDASVTIDDCFAVTLGSPGIGPDMKPIYVEDGLLDLNGATLIVRADSRNLKLDTPYPIIENDGGIVNNEWAAELEKGYANKSIVVNWVDIDEDGEIDEDDLGEYSAVIFTYDPTEASPEDVLAPGMGGMTGVPILVSSITQQLNPFSPLNVDTLLVKDKRKSVLLASNGVSDEGLPGLGATERYRGFWFMPVYTRIVGDDLGYDATGYGLALGIGGKISDAGYLGGYAGYTKGNLEFDIDSGDTEEQNIFFGGINGMYGPAPWYIRFGAIGYYADHSYKGYTGLMYDLKEKAEYNSIGGEAEVVVGGSFGDSVRFVPEAGLGYQYTSTESFKTKVPDDDTWERKIEPEEISVLKGILGMSVIAGVGSPTQFYLGARLEYALSDNDVKATNSLLGGTEFDIERDMDDSLLSLTAGLNHEFGNSWSLEFGLRGDLSSDYNAYTGRLFIRKSF